MKSFSEFTEKPEVLDESRIDENKWKMPWSYLGTALKEIDRHTKEVKRIKKLSEQKNKGQEYSNSQYGDLLMSLDKLSSEAKEAGRRLENVVYSDELKRRRG
jgi:hypothetical protein